MTTNVDISSDKAGDDSEEEEEEKPSLEEHCSLLSLAAEHDRVDVIQELLNTDDLSLRAVLLGGLSEKATEKISSSQESNNDAEEGDFLFVPPPLHAAVAHGSIHASSCLLRMGADPSIRPDVPRASSSSSYAKNRRGDDGNLQKYHDMSAWELAFGSSEPAAVAEEEQAEEEEAPQNRGWFGFAFGTSAKEPAKKQSLDDSSVRSSTRAVTPKRRRRSPLNIAPSKLEGIRHAFTAEALRAIGSDEVERLRQLLDAGMDLQMEVAGRTLQGWALEMEARDCCRAWGIGKYGSKDSTDGTLSHPDAQQTQAHSKIAAEPTTKVQTLNNHAPKHPSKDKDLAEKPQETTPTSPTPIPPDPIEQKFAHLSTHDIQTLLHEQTNLLPALTQCHDNLAMETSIYQQILRDIQTNGAGLQSRSLIDNVRALKEQRHDFEEALRRSQLDWEEREDELDYLWEDVLDDRLRRECIAAGIFRESAEEPLIASGDTREESTHRLHNIENRIRNLRASIADLAEENAKCQTHIESVGMSGALALTRSLRDEVKELESQLVRAKQGERVARSKIEFIRQRLDGGNQVGGQSGSQSVEREVQHGTNGVCEQSLDDKLEQSSSGRESPVDPPKSLATHSTTESESEIESSMNPTTQSVARHDIKPTAEPVTQPITESPTGHLTTSHNPIDGIHTQTKTDPTDSSDNNGDQANNEIDDKVDSLESHHSHDSNNGNEYLDSSNQSEEVDHILNSNNVNHEDSPNFDQAKSVNNPDEYTNEYIQTDYDYANEEIIDVDNVSLQSVSDDGSAVERSDDDSDETSYTEESASYTEESGSYTEESGSYTEESEGYTESEGYSEGDMEMNEGNEMEMETETEVVGGTGVEGGVFEGTMREIVEQSSIKSAVEESTIKSAVEESPIKSAVEESKIVAMTRGENDMEKAKADEEVNEEMLVVQEAAITNDHGERKVSNTMEQTQESSKMEGNDLNLDALDKAKMTNAPCPGSDLTKQEMISEASVDNKSNGEDLIDRNIGKGDHSQNTILNTNNDSSPRDETISENQIVVSPGGNLKPSDALSSGASTSIVVRSPDGQPSSISTQIWDLIRRIVGFPRPRATLRSHYHYDDANNSHIMIV